MAAANFLAAALKIARKGWPVFPCASHGKTPLTEHGFLDASTDPAVIRKWWLDYPDANIGIATGAAGLDVIDIDEKNGGFESFAKLCKEYGPLESITVLTGGGGEHLYFKARPGVVIKSRSNAFGPAYPGIDVRAEGGYVIAPPSIHPNGRAYVAEASNGTTMATLPGWAAQLLSGPDQTPIRGVDNDEKISQGGRHAELMRLAGRLRRLNTSQVVILEVVSAVNRLRCAPPISDKDVDHIVESAMRYAPAEHLTPAPALPPQAAVMSYDELALRVGVHVDWIVEGFVRRSGLLLVAAAPKVGKSELGRNLAKAIATGSTFLGRRCQRGSVLWIGLEEPESHLIDRLEVMEFNGLSVSYVTEQPQGDEAQWLRAQIEKYTPDLVVIDTIGRFSKVENVNDYSQVTRATQPLLDLRTRYGTTFALLYHTNNMGIVLGSTMWRGVVDTIMCLTRNTDGVRFVKTVQRSGVDLESTATSMDPDTGHVTMVEPKFMADQRVAEGKILRYVSSNGTVTREDASGHCGRARSVGRAALDALVSAGLLVCKGSGAKGDPRSYALPNASHNNMRDIEGEECEECEESSNPPLRAIAKDVRGIREPLRPIADIREECEESRTIANFAGSDDSLDLLAYARAKIGGGA